MDRQITVLGRATSSNVQAVMWGAAELGLTVDRQDYGHVYGGNDTPEFLAMNPFGLVPVLVDGDLTMFESCAILRYLGAAYGDGGAFWPADPVARARVDMWAEWGKCSFARDFTGPIFWSVVRTAAVDRDVDALERALAKFNGYLQKLDSQLEGKQFVTGDDLTLADVAIAHVLYRYYEVPIERQVLRNVDRYYQMLTERPAYAENVMVSFDALRVPGA